MFTGVITHIGKIKDIKRDENKDIKIWVDVLFNTSDVNIGASICCSGACLTVIEKEDYAFLAEVSYETLRCTTLGGWVIGTKINLERALKVGDELGGHIVSGHVDCVANVHSIEETEGSHKVTIETPNDFAKFIAAKGSIVLEGISLTVNEADKNTFSVNIIPHTWENTTFSDLKSGSKINLEIDMLARYVLNKNIYN